MPDPDTKELRIDELEKAAQESKDKNQDAKIAATDKRIDAYITVFQDKAWLILKAAGVGALIVASTIATVTWRVSDQVAMNESNTVRIEQLEKLHPKRAVAPKPEKKGFFRRLIEGD